MKSSTCLKILLLLIGFIPVNFIYAQSSSEVLIQHGSFEETSPHQGRERQYRVIKGWYDCGPKNFKNVTPPDIHGENYYNDQFWDNELKASEGRNYLGMVVRANDTWESLSQRLEENLQKGKCYTLSMEMAQSPKYLSHTDKDQGKINRKKSNFTTPVVLRVWGGSAYCEKKQLLSESKPITHADWKTYDFTFKSKFSHKYITLEAFYKTPILVPYNGHVLIDNVSNFNLIPCPDEEIVAVAKSKKYVPPHKKKKKKKKQQKEVIPDAQEADIVYVPPPVIKKKSNKTRILKELNRSTIKKGQRINIESLFFTADTSKINESSFLVLDEVYEFLNDNQTIVVEIGGHTNNTPSHNYCDKLSSDRAKEVAWYLIEKGIDSKRVEYKGYGKRKPIASNRSKAGRLKNQRVEIKILSV